eukprot:c39565_g1_i1 orf=1-660(-)
METAESRLEPFLAKSSFRDSRILCETLSRSNSLENPDVRGKDRKGQRSGNDIFVCFSPSTSLSLVPRAGLSPRRENGREGGRRSRAQAGSPVFSLSRFEKAGKKQGYDVVTEPTSPKVTCIGQVRVKQKQSRTWETVMQEFESFREEVFRKLKIKVVSSSPRRSCSSPSRSLKWGPLFGSKKESNSHVWPRFPLHFSCFGLPCDTRTNMPSYRKGKGCGA